MNEMLENVLGAAGSQEGCRLWKAGDSRNVTSSAARRHTLGVLLWKIQGDPVDLSAASSNALLA